MAPSWQNPGWRGVFLRRSVVITSAVNRTTGAADQPRIVVVVEETSGVDKRPEAPTCT